MEFNKLVIIGEPGSGKTTACQRAACELARDSYKKLKQSTWQEGEKPVIPLYLPLIKFAGNEGNTGQRMLSKIHKIFVPCFPDFDKVQDFLKYFLSKYRLILFLDGLNELSPLVYHEIVNEALELQENYDSAISFIATSRKHNFDVDKFKKMGFEILDILELSQNDIRPFASCYLYDEVSVDRFMKGLNRQLKALARNPLILCLLLDNFKKGKSSIGSRAELLKIFLSRCLEKPCESVSPSPLSKQVLLKEKILIDIAFYMWKSDYSLRASMKACIDIAEKILDEPGKANAVINELAENGVFSHEIDENRQGFITFRSQAYHEYFCAKRVSKIWRSGPTRSFNSILKDRNWHEIIALSAGVMEIEKNLSDPGSLKPEIDLIQYLKKKGEIILIGMCIWNMQAMNQELKPFEKWLVERAQNSCRILTRISKYMLFFVVLPIWIIAFFLAIVFRNEYGSYYTWKISFPLFDFYIDLNFLLLLSIFVLVPLVLNFIFKRISSWIANRHERGFFRPSLMALYFIGSDFARGAIVNLFDNRDLVAGKKRYLGFQQLNQPAPFIQKYKGEW